MHILLVNGSPRGANSNTMVFYQCFLKGFLTRPGNSYEVIHLSQMTLWKEQLRKFTEAERVILAFPLYTDTMPGLVKAFLEELEGSAGAFQNLRLGFIIQCGFPEALHLRPLEKYLEKLTRRLGCVHSGTIVKGAGEFIRVLPEILNQPVYARFRALGRAYARAGEFTPKMIRRFAWFNRFPKWILPLTWPIIDPVARKYWHRQLRDNQAMERRFAQPYL